MGKKGGKSGGGALPKSEFNDLLSQLSKLEKEPEQKKVSAAERRVRRKEMEKEKSRRAQEEEMRKAQEARRQQEQFESFFEMLKQRMAQQQADYLKEADTEKHVAEETTDLVTVSAVGMQGWRANMEDAHLVKNDADDQVAVYGVFDGHSGDEVSKYAGEHLLAKLKEQPEWKARDFPAALEKGFMALDAEMKEKEQTSGSTATVVVVDYKAGKIHCANAGDSRAIMSVAGKAVDLSEDHKPLLESEKERIEAAGSTVEVVGSIGRVNGSLAVSRGFGDFQFKAADGIAPEKQAVTAFPEVKSFDLTKEVEYIVVACDGIWDCLTSEEVVERVGEKVKGAANVAAVTDATKELFDAIVSPEPAAIGSDNMSMVTIRFNKHN